MSVFNQFPYTNFHELNLDWLIKEFKKLKDEWESFGYSVTASAEVGTVPSVEVSGDLINGLNFKFTLVKGETGATGATGATGNGIASVTFDSSDRLVFTFTDGTTYTTPSLKGDIGEGLKILGVYATLAALQSAHPTGSAGDMYQVGTSPNFTLYVWNGAAWTNAGTLSSPSASSTTPLMDGVAAVGSEAAFARGDHRHPSDTSKADASDLASAVNDISDLSSSVTALTGTVEDDGDRLTALENSSTSLTNRVGDLETAVSAIDVSTIGQYQYDDIVSFGGQIFPGVLSNSRKRVVFSVPLPKSVDAMRNTYLIDILTGTLNIRDTEGNFLPAANTNYLAGSYDFGYQLVNYGNMLIFQIDFNTAVGTVNNIPVAVQAVDFSFQFQYDDSSI